MLARGADTDDYARLQSVFDVALRAGFAGVIAHYVEEARAPAKNCGFSSTPSFFGPLRRAVSATRRAARGRRPRRRCASTRWP